ncbi:MAG: serine/threonine protein kinase [Polaromonas sp.]|nr:serine/threonine protein kinase [Polaromonas sp.]
MSSHPPPPLPAPSPLDAAREFCNQRGYDLGDDLGSGAFKVVYNATIEGAPFALKVAPVYGSTERFERETGALLSCAHPSIATLREGLLFEMGPAKFWLVVEELLSGGTLETRLAAGLLTQEEVRTIGAHLADALAHLQERRLVHRDVKPANILFRNDLAIPVLTDFGIVRVLDAPTITQAFAAQGPNTPAFAAPEQLNNEMPLIDGRTDQFGLSVVLVMSLLGRHPYMGEGEHIQHAIERVRARQPMPAQNIDFLTAQGFTSLIKALQPWPAQRYRKTTEFAKAIRTS